MAQPSFASAVDVSGVVPIGAVGPRRLEARAMTKRFGDLVALRDVSFTLEPGSFHALLGENGAGKSTLVKCIMGFYQADSGSLSLGDSKVVVKSPKDAQRHGIGMVYQHFTLVENMTVAENLVLSRANVPLVVDWRGEERRLDAFMETTPFRVPPRKLVRQLAAGEKQKLEIIKQLYLGSRIVILDEPTSVLTPQEADDVLGMLRQMARDGRISVAMITHRFREVMEFADAVTVLRRGELAGVGIPKDLGPAAMAEMMMGREPPKPALERTSSLAAAPVLTLSELTADDDIGLPVLRGVSLGVSAGEIVGIAGVSGNGQDELVEVLSGQRRSTGGAVHIGGEAFTPTRKQMRAQRLRLLPEAPLQNACVGEMTVAENLAFRSFDESPLAAFGWIVKPGAIRERARGAIQDYGIRTRSPDSPIGSLSGGNVQRAVLARELTGDVAVLVAANPCFGLDFAAVAEIRSRIMAARNGGTAVLLVSTDLDEIFALSDRILVMSGGRVVHETTPNATTSTELGRHMAGGH